MNKLLSARFDIVMANLKPIEPSDGFDFEFGRRLRDAALSRRQEPAILRAARLALENMRLNILPGTPVFVRVAASFAFVFSIGLYVYGSQPMQPAIFSQGAMVAECISAGAIVETGTGESVDIVLKDRYTLRLKENTRIRVAGLTPRMWRGTADFRLARGNALISVERGFKGSKFIVDTGAGQATALGTKFSVAVSEDDKAKTHIAVLEDKVKVASAYRPKSTLAASNVVMVGSGQKTEMSAGSLPERPERLMEEEWLKLEELYQIGKKQQVVLLLKNVPGRVYQLLKPCPLYVSDQKPREIPTAFDDAVRKIEEALRTGDRAKHLEAIGLLEAIVGRYSNPKYDPQFLLYIGSYYEYLDDHARAIASFERVVERYPDSRYASLAVAAIGVIYDEKVKDAARAERAFKTILKNYPNTLEAIFAEGRLGIKKVS